MIFFSSIQSILSIIIMISIGYILTSKGWFSEDTSKTIAKLVTFISLPALMIANLMGTFDKSKLESMSTGLIIPFVSIFICYIAAILFSLLLKIDKNKTGCFQSMFFNSNTIFIGLPVNLALFGTRSIPYVLLYYIANTTFFWTLGVYCICKDSSKNSPKILSKDTLKRIVSPPLMGFIIAIILILLQIKLPQFVMDTCKYLGGLTTPLSMIFIGICIHSVKLKDIKLSRDMLGIICGRFLVSPGIIYLLLIAAPFPLLLKKVFIIQAAMPVMTQSSIVAKTYGADSSYTAVMTTVTTILSMITIPIFMMLLSLIK